MTSVDISMFDTDELKLTLFYTLIQRSTNRSQFMIGEVNLAHHKEILDRVKKGFIDYYDGIGFKSNISGDTFNTYLYNRDNGGPGTAERIVNYIKAELNL
jgi:hypothetical protein